MFSEGKSTDKSKHYQQEIVDNMQHHEPAKVNIKSRNMPYSPYDEKFQSAQMMQENMKKRN